MKKLISIILTAAMLLTLAACAGEAADTPRIPEVKPTDAQPVGETQPESKSESELRFAQSYEEVYGELVSRAEAMYEQSRDMNMVITDEVPEAPAAEPSENTNSYSQTNVQVSGIDEGDIVKTDGEYIYILQNAMMESAELIILKADGADTAVVSRCPLAQFKACGTPLEGEHGATTVERIAREFFISGDRLAVIYDKWTLSEVESDIGWRYRSQSAAQVDVYDISSPESPELIASLGQDGRALGTRLYKGRLYMLSSWGEYETEVGDIPDCIPAVYREENRETIPANDICICTHSNSTNFIVAAVYDLENAELLDTQTVLGGGSEVYMSGENIYILGRAWSDGAGQPRQEGIYSVVDYAPSTNTSVFRFAADENGLSLEAEGLVPGYMESRFSAHEYGGYLHLVTTLSRSSYTVYTDEEKGFVNYEWHESQSDTNGLYILDEALNIVGSVENLAEGERVYSARFDGAMAYFCTFEQVDPLFAVDCSDPAKPVVLSALKISGFSEYLHQWDENRLFGFGCEADEEDSRIQGLKMVMVDTSDKADVIAENSLHLEDIMWSEALYEPHAMFISPEKNIIGFVGDGVYYIYGYSVGDGFYLRAELDFHGRGYGARGLYIGSEIYLLGRDGGYVLDLESCSLIKNLYW